MPLRKDAQIIIEQALAAVLPHRAVCSVLAGRPFPGRVFMVAIGKAAYDMAAAAAESLGDQLSRGNVITKYGHGKPEPIPRTQVQFAGHPVPDENGLKATALALEMVHGL